MSIGSQIKKRRREKGLTQEELALYLGISGKAVSQWERDKTTPDISLLPALCNLFEVASDELLEIDVKSKDQRIQQILDEQRKLSQNGYKQEALTLLTQALREFPGDYRLMDAFESTATFIVHSIGTAYPHYSAEEKKALEEQCIHYCERILQGSTDDRLRQNAISSLCGYYAKRGEIQKAQEMASKMPILHQSRDFLLPFLHKGSKKAEYELALMGNLLQMFANLMVRNHELDGGETLYSEQELALIHQKRIDLLTSLFDQGDLGFYNGFLYDSHRALALHHAKNNRQEETLHHLEKAAETAIAYLRFLSSDSFVYASLPFKSMEMQGRSVSFATAENAASALLNSLTDAAYDFVRQTDRFRAVVEKLEPFAK